MLMERGHLQDGDHVALVYPPGEQQTSWGSAEPHKGPPATVHASDDAQAVKSRLVQFAAEETVF